MERIRLKLINSAGQILQTCPALTRIEAWGTEAGNPRRDPGLRAVRPFRGGLGVLLSIWYNKK